MTSSMKYIVYKFDEKVPSMTAKVLTSREAFQWMGVKDVELPKLISGQSVNIPELDRLMLDCDTIWLHYKQESWVITKIKK